MRKDPRPKVFLPPRPNGGNVFTTKIIVDRMFADRFWGSCVCHQEPSVCGTHFKPEGTSDDELHEAAYEAVTKWQELPPSRDERGLIRPPRIKEKYGEVAA